MGRWFLTIAIVLAVSTVEMQDGLHFETASRQVGEQGSDKRRVAIGSDTKEARQLRPAAERQQD